MRPAGVDAGISISVDPELMVAADILEGEQVSVVDIDNRQVPDDLAQAFAGERRYVEVPA